MKLDIAKIKREIYPNVPLASEAAIKAVLTHININLPNYLVKEEVVREQDSNWPDWMKWRYVEQCK